MWLTPKRTRTVGRLLAGALKPVAGDLQAATETPSIVMAIYPMPYQTSARSWHC